jgi:hypothetical protein
VSAFPLDEDIQSSVPLAHQEENMVSYNPFENFDDTLFHDFESKELIEEPLKAIDPSCNDMVKNIDDFICIGRCRWDLVVFLMDIPSMTSRETFR